MGLVKELQQPGFGLTFYSHQLWLALSQVCPHFISCLVNFLQLKTDPFLHVSGWEANGITSHLCVFPAPVPSAPYWSQGVTFLLSLFCSSGPIPPWSTGYLSRSQVPDVEVDSRSGVIRKLVCQGNNCLLWQLGDYSFLHPAMAAHTGDSVLNRCLVRFCT